MIDMKTANIPEYLMAADFLEEQGFGDAAEILRNVAMIRLQEFCMPEYGGERFNCSMPFRQDGYLWATDRRVMVRIPQHGPETVPPEGRFPQVLKLWNEYMVKEESLFSKEWRPWPHGFNPIETDRPISETCPVCRGNMGFWIAGDEVTCIYCDGQGVLGPAENQSNGETEIGGKYYRLISKLPNVWYRDKLREESPLHFRFDGGEGLLMPIVRK